jgi:uncharacterized protein YecT (DUF1311 family)
MALTKIIFFVVLAALGWMVMLCSGTAEDCHSAVGQTEINICADRDAANADAELNTVYKKLWAKTSPEGRNHLKTAEKSWLKYRAEQCSFDTFGSRDGSVHDMVLALCYQDMALRQARHLQEQLDCEEGHLSCGHQ